MKNKNRTIVVHFGDENQYRDIISDGKIFVELVVVYVLIHVYVYKYFPRINKLTGAILAFGPFLAAFFIGYGTPAATGALTFLAISLIIASVRVDSGCEVMSIPSLILGKHTHLACLIFSPIDMIEKKIRS